MTKLMYYKKLTKQWEALKSDKENVDAVIKQLRSLQAENKDLKTLSENHSFSWAQKLNVLSDSLPHGVWFKRLTFQDKRLFIEGSAISKGKDEMISVHQLTSNLKTSDAFLNDFTDLEVSSIQRRKLNNIEIADFLITSKTK